MQELKKWSSVPSKASSKGKIDVLCIWKQKSNVLHLGLLIWHKALTATLWECQPLSFAYILTGPSRVRGESHAFLLP